jgi:hypothetical protein
MSVIEGEFVDPKPIDETKTDTVLPQGPTPAQMIQIQRVIRKICRVLDHEKASISVTMSALGTLQQTLFQQLQQQAKQNEEKGRIIT